MRMRERLRDESGLTMAELLIGMFLTAMMMVMAGSMFVQMTKLTTSSNQTQNATRIASSTAKSITDVLGTATNLALQNSAVPDPAIIAGSRSSITLYSYTNADPTNPAPTKVTYTLDATGKLTEARCTAKPSGVYWSFATCGSSTTRTLATTIQNPSGSVPALFTYRNADGVAYDIGTGALTDTQRANVSSITVQVSALPIGATGNAAVINNTVVLRNIGLGSNQS